MTKKEQKAAEVLANKFASYDKKVRTLTAHASFPARLIAEGFASGKVAETLAAEIAALEPVGAALHQQKAEAVQMASEAAKKRVEAIKADLEAHGWDMKQAAPDVRDHWSHEYQINKTKRSEIYAVTAPDRTKPTSYSIDRNAPSYVVMCDKSIARYITSAEQDAAFEYDLFICKMVGKVGVCDSATIKGNHIWSYSHLIVTKAEKTEVWKTQQIWNTSKLGKQFPQWPSRLMKGGK